MKQCLYCKEYIEEHAIKCRYCHSMLIPAQAGSQSNGDVTYVLDKGLVRSGKFALAVLGIFTVVGLSLFGYRLSDMANQLTKAQEALGEALSKLDSAQTTMDAGLEQLGKSVQRIESLQAKTEVLEEKAQRSVTQISMRESRSKELLIAMETSAGGSAVIRTTVATAEEPQNIGTSKLWENGQILKIAFLSDEEEIHNAVVEVAIEWTEYANLHFEFGADPDDADIRISFQENSGAWSFVGKDSRIVPRTESTMNLDPRLLENDFATIVLLYFGHAIGLLKEHQNPNAEIPRDRKAVYSYFGSPPNNWSQEQVDFNLFAEWPVHSFGLNKPYDRESIMHDAILNVWTVGAFEIPNSKQLSQGDKDWVGRLYPKNE